MSTLEFVSEFLFKPLNTASIDWQKRHNGYYDGSGLGLQKLFDENEKSITKWGLNKSKHGFCWCKSKFNGDAIDYGMDYGGQFMIMTANKELIIVATNNHYTANGIEQQMKFLNGKLPKLIE